MRLYLAIVVSLSSWNASESVSSRIEQHWLQETENVVSDQPPRRMEQGFFTPAPTAGNTEDATGDIGGVDPDNNDGSETDPPTSEPSPKDNGADRTPAPTESEAGIGGTPAPTETPGGFGGTPAPSESAGDLGGTPAPTESQGFGTPAPTESRGFGTPAPTQIQWSETPAPTEPHPAPVDSFPREAPTPRPESEYVATDDDPLQPVSPGTEEDAAWQWKDSNADDVEHDRTVLIALTVTFSIGVCLAIITAQQMLENPNGCCVSICRILVALTCGITRCACYPCRAMCGCTNTDRRNHEIMLQSDDNYTHDLELS